MLLCGVLGCASSPVEPWDLVPTTSVFVMHLDWERIQRDEGLRKAIRDAGAERVLAIPGVENSQIRTLVAFSGVSGSVTQDGAIIAKGRFERTALAQQVTRRKLQERSYRGQSVYHDPQSGAHAAVLSPDTIVVGIQAAVEDAIKTAQGLTPRFRDRPEALSMLEKVGTRSYPVTLLILVPENYRDAGAVAVDVSSMILGTLGLSPLGVVLERIGLPGALALGLSVNGKEYPVELTATMQDEESARFVAGGLTLVQGLASLLPELKSEGRAVGGYKDFMVARSGPTISVKLTITDFGK
jgi:hypothetical protein